jgi:hypothetical protein
MVETVTQQPPNTPHQSTVDNCHLCGLIHLTTTGAPSCNGHIPCRRRPTHGQHCMTHRMAGEVLLGPVVGRPVRDPLEGLSSLAGRVEAWLDVAHARLERSPSFGDGEGRLRSEMKAFAVLVSRLTYLLSTMSRLDLDERLIRLDRVQADQFREFVEIVMRDPQLALSDEQQAEWPRAFARAARRRVSAITMDGEVA